MKNMPIATRVFLILQMFNITRYIENLSGVLVDKYQNIKNLGGYAADPIGWFTAPPKPRVVASLASLRLFKRLDALGGDTITTQPWVSPSLVTPLSSGKIW